MQGKSSHSNVFAEEVTRTSPGERPRISTLPISLRLWHDIFPQRRERESPSPSQYGSKTRASFRLGTSTILGSLRTAELFRDEHKWSGVDACIERVKSQTVRSACDLGGGTEMQAEIWYQQRQLGDVCAYSRSAVGSFGGSKKQMGSRVSRESEIFCGGEFL